MVYSQSTEVALEQNKESVMPTGTETAKPAASWVNKVMKASEDDTRAQPWKEALGVTHDKGLEGEDLINLNLPNYVQCGGLGA